MSVISYVASVVLLLAHAMFAAPAAPGDVANHDDVVEYAGLSQGVLVAIELENGAVLPTTFYPFLEPGVVSWDLPAGVRLADLERAFVHIAVHGHDGWRSVRRELKPQPVSQYRCPSKVGCIKVFRIGKWCAYICEAQPTSAF